MKHYKKIDLYIVLASTYAQPINLRRVKRRLKSIWIRLNTNLIHSLDWLFLIATF